MSQTFDDWELIIIDDGSTDNTKGLVERFSTKDSRIKYHFQTNSERSVARNNGIKLAKGKYICFIDSDDQYEENHLDRLNANIKKSNHKKCMFFCNVSRLENGSKIKVPFEAVENYKNSIEYILLSKETVIPARVCIHSDILKQYQFDESLNVSEDTELFSRILSMYPLIQLNFYGAIYSIHDQNTTNLNHNPYVGQLKSLKKIFSNKSLQPHLIKKTIKKKLSSCYFGIAKYHLLKHNTLKARYYLFISIIKDLQSKSTKHKLFLFLKGRIE